MHTVLSKTQCVGNGFRQRLEQNTWKHILKTQRLHVKQYVLYQEYILGCIENAIQYLQKHKALLFIELDTVSTWF